MSTRSETGHTGVSIELCGALRLSVDGRRCEGELPGRLGRLLLAYLALNRERAVTRDELVDALWPIRAPDDPGRTLSTLVSGLRRCLGRERVPGRTELRLVLPLGGAIDVERALGALQRAQAALAGARPVAAAADAAIAAEILGRRLLADHDAPWLNARRRELEEAGHDALELVARAELAAGGDAVPRAVATSRRLVELAPYRESAYGALMEAQAAGGNLGEALRTFERVRQVMRDELGVPPSWELRALHAGLLSQADEAAAAASVLPAALERVARRPFVGREDALGVLERELEAAAEGERRFVFLGGEPGIGKTSVAAAFAARAHGQGAVTVLYGRCTEEPLAPYAPFVEMLGTIAADGGDDRYRLFEEVTAALQRAADGRLLLLVVDDLHWADAGTLELLGHLARAEAFARVLVVGTYRSEHAPRGSRLGELMADLRREQSFASVSLGGLDDEEARGMVEAAGLDGPPPDAVRLRAMTGGNPLFLVELLRALEERGGTLDELEIPEGIRDVVLRRVARLGGPLQELLTLAAVAGQTFRVSALALDDAGGPERVAGAVDRAVAARLLTPTADPGVLSFSHALIRETLYAELGDARRAVLHLRLAESRATTSRRGTSPGPSRRSATGGPPPSAPLLRSRGRTRRASSSARCRPTSCASHPIPPTAASCCSRSARCTRAPATVRRARRSRRRRGSRAGARPRSSRARRSATAGATTRPASSTRS
jgi:DNA-binding SARP family transcriptional activator